MFEATIASLLALVVGLTQVVKISLPEKLQKLAPVVSLVFGLGLAFLFVSDTREAVWTGLFIGLSASGLYSGSKALLSK